MTIGIFGQKFVTFGCWMLCGTFFQYGGDEKVAFEMFKQQQNGTPIYCNLQSRIWGAWLVGWYCKPAGVACKKTSGWYVRIQYRMPSNKLNLTWMYWLVRTYFSSIAIQQRPKESFLCHSGFNNEAPIS